MPAAGWRVLQVGVEAAAELAALHRHCFNEPWDVEAMAAMLAGGQAFIAGAERPLGFALARLAADEAELLSLGVVAEARRQGLGNALLRALIAWAAAAGARALLLEVAVDNVAARTLYRRHGCTEVGRRRGYYAGGDALLLSLDLRGRPIQRLRSSSR
jgi:ribosomal-protein-alanine N-acetyltransferase